MCIILRHLPRGRCGLKFSWATDVSGTTWSPSARKVWIEISVPIAHSFILMSPSARKVWIEIGITGSGIGSTMSPSARKVWIEIRDQRPPVQLFSRHLPRGRCGLKLSSEEAMNAANTGHLPRGRCGLKSALSPACAAFSTVTFREEGVD